MSQFNIGVLGGGVIGLTSAICIQNRYPNCNVTIITDQLSPHTTADGSAGLWMPYLLENTPMDKIIKWSEATYNHFHHLWRSGLADVTGVSLITCLNLVTVNEPYAVPLWATSICHGIHEISREQIEKFSKEHKRNYRGGFYFTAFTCEPVKWLPYLMNQFLNRGGKIVQHRVNTLAELIERAKFDILINCCGISARDVVPDRRVHAIRGQVARVRAPWVFHAMFSEDNYIIPNQDAVILGGTHQEHNYSTQISMEDSKAIFGGCYQLIPGLKTSPLIKEWVGLRPARDCVRLELEIIEPPGPPSKSTTGISTVQQGQTLSSATRTRKSLIVIHNYGHGGAGVTLSWGCALNVTELVGEALEHLSSTEKTTTNNIQSHL